MHPNRPQCRRALGDESSSGAAMHTSERAAPSGRVFQILAMSGGGYRGLYTAKVLADLESDIGQPIARYFDLIAGTSVGGILALALAMEIPAQRIVDLFVDSGDAIFKKRFSFGGILRAPYSPKPLEALLMSEDLFGERLLGDCLHPVIVPAINYSSGKPVVFKTPHHPNFKRDHKYRLVDIALATSAAPAYFPRHVFDNQQYVDGGLFANAPGVLANHEALCFFGCRQEEVRMLSVGTMSSLFTVDARANRAGGTLDWGGVNPGNTPKQLFGLAISVAESLTDFVLQHRLGANYHHLDDKLTERRSGAVALDKTNAAAREVLLGAATERSKFAIGSADIQLLFKTTATPAAFHYGARALKE
jgi:uncharacterized protein